MVSPRAPSNLNPFPDLLAPDGGERWIFDAAFILAQLVTADDQSLDAVTLVRNLLDNLARFLCEARSDPRSGFPLLARSRMDCPKKSSCRDFDCVLLHPKNRTWKCRDGAGCKKGAACTLLHPDLRGVSMPPNPAPPVAGGGMSVTPAQHGGYSAAAAGGGGADWSAWAAGERPNAFEVRGLLRHSQSHSQRSSPPSSNRASPAAPSLSPNLSPSVRASHVHGTPDEHAYKSHVGGVKMGYSGHVPGGRDHFGSAAVAGSMEVRRPLDCSGLLLIALGCSGRKLYVFAMVSDRV